MESSQGSEPGADAQSRVRLSQVARRKIYHAVATASIMVLVAGQAHLGFLFFLFLAPLAVWLSYGTYIIITRPYLRVAQGISILVWVGAILLLVLVHYIRHNSARSDANEVAQAINQYSTANGRCPRELKDLQVTRPDIPEKLQADFNYSCTNQKPKFSYMVTFTIFDTYEYDFQKSRWAYQDWSKKKAWLDTW
jgi:hypothetical protein